MPISTIDKIEQPQVYIIILNWNGWKDTIECIDSIIQQEYSNYKIILIDNCSGDDSVTKIHEWAQGVIPSQSLYGKFPKKEEAINILRISESEIETKPLKNENAKIVLIQTEENLGFAKGSNIGIKYALNNQADYVFLLNNDTYIFNKSITELIDFLEKNKNYFAATSQIRYYDNKTIWHCGGNVTWFYSLKYMFPDENILQIPNEGYSDISFVSGCAMMLPVEKLKTFGLLTDRFFFGEEDFEFALRAKKKNLKMACIYSSIILHKVSSSIKKISGNNFSINSAFHYYLCRIINVKHNSNKLFWFFWSAIYSIHIFNFLLKKRISMSRIFHFHFKLLYYSWKNNSVSKELFIKIMNEMKF
jgi:GT2 family glycosyltransferase